MDAFYEGRVSFPDTIADSSITDADIVSTGISRITDGSITSADIADGAITAAKIAAGVIPELGGIADNSITGAKIQDGTITSSDIADDAVTSPNIADGTISDTDITTAGISRIMDGAITNAKIAEGEVTDANIIPTGITRIADDAVTSAKVVDGEIQTADLAENAATRAYQVYAQTWRLTTEPADLPDMSLTITTDESPVLIIFSGEFYNDTAGREVRIVVAVDELQKMSTFRFGISSSANEAFVLATSWMEMLSAGTHTIKIQWGVDAGTGAVVYRAMQVIEFRR